jgi:hypothetical protein
MDPSATAENHGLVAQTEPIDTFADAVSRLSDAEVDLDPIERLLLAIERAGIVDGRQGDYHVYRPRRT